MIGGKQEQMDERTGVVAEHPGELLAVCVYKWCLCHVL